jgi:foldase protein PrsA
MAPRSLFTLISLVAVLLVAGCGGGGGVPEDSVAVVDGDSITQQQYDALIAQAKKTFKQDKREFPKAGTAERKQLDQIKKQSFGGDQKRNEEQLKKQGLTDAQVRTDIKANLISEKLYESVTKDLKVTDADVKKYYEDNKAQYGTPESRDVRHILVKTRAQADKLYDQLKAGANFATLAKKFSLDPGSKDQGGKYTVVKGQTVAPFEQTSFLLEKGDISRPVKTQYGYHIIQPLGEIKPAKTQPLDKTLTTQIRAQLLKTKKDAAMNTWVKDLEKSYEDKVDYAAGFAPPPTSSGSTASK